MRPEPEARQSDIGETIGETLEKNMATMWPDLCPKSGPSFWLGLGEYLKIPYLGPTLSLAARATFWPTVWPQSGHILIKLFKISNLLFSKTPVNSGRILALNRGRHQASRAELRAAV